MSLSLSRLVIGTAEIRFNSPLFHEFFFPYILLTRQYNTLMLALQLLDLLYIELTISFLIGRSVQWIFEISAYDVITTDYTIITSRSRIIMSCMTAVHDF